MTGKSQLPEVRTAPSIRRTMGDVDAPSLPTPVSPPRILVIDDELLLLKICARALRPCIVEVASSGALALARLATLPAFDLVLCDLHLPDFYGRDLYRHACTHAPELRTRFLFITGDCATPPPDLDDDSSTVRVLSKPFDPTVLRATVQDLLSRLPPVARS